VILWEDYQGNRHTQQLQSNTAIIRARSNVRSARSQNRSAAWAYNLAQWRQYRPRELPALHVAFPTASRLDRHNHMERDLGDVGPQPGQ
jgi:hypothetical protein